MKKNNRTTLKTEPLPQQTGAALESKPTRGKHPNSRRKKDPENPMVKITRYVYENQSHVSGKELREMIPPKSQPKTGIQNSDPAE